MRNPHLPITALLTAVAVASCGDPLRPLDVTLTIVSPAEGTSILAGDSVTLAVQVELASGHEAAAIDVIWSAEEGVLGTGDSLRVRFMSEGEQGITATVDLGSEGRQHAHRSLVVLPNSLPAITAFFLRARAFDRDTIPLVASGTDAESLVEIVWLDGVTELGRSASGDTLWWTPGGAAGDRAVTARATDAQGFASDTTATIRVSGDETIRWITHGGSWKPGAMRSDDAVLARADDGSLAVGFYGGSPCGPACLFVFRADGSLRWQTVLDAGLWDHSSGLTYSPDGSLFVFDFQGIGYRFAPDGTPVWKRLVLGGDPHGRFALDPAGRLYASGNTASGPALVRLDPATGSDIWRITRACGYAAGPAVLRDSTLSAQTCNVFRRFAPDGAPVGDTLVAPRAHYISAADMRGYTYLSTYTSFQEPMRLVAVGPDNTVRWQVQFPHRPGEAVIDADTVVYTGSADGSWSAPDGRTLVRALAHDGTIRWTQNVPGAAYIIRFAALSDGTLYVAAGFYLHTLSRATGAVLRTLEFPAPISTSPAVGPDGIVYVVIGDGRLVAVQGHAGLDPNAPWPIWRRDNARTASVPRP